MDTTETAKFVADLRAQILTGALPNGAKLDAERELALQHKLSRTTIRAGLQSLEAAGLITRRIGRGGGSFITVPDGDSVASTLQLVIGAGGLAEADLMETRLAIEPMCAELAATRMSDDELDELSSIQSRMSATLHAVGTPTDRRAFLRANADFHLTIARGSRNGVLSAILEGLIGPIEALTDDPETIGPRQLRELIQAHEAIYSALRHRDSRCAGEVMRKHLRAHIRLSARS